jgi:hypothetical protein
MKHPLLTLLLLAVVLVPWLALVAIADWFHAHRAHAAGA